ncbi:Ig domain-containing protein [Vagococcus entomophilus]|uniref:BIG2 domain-containing protein n=1 Tax=Vagococcus entomophilus TaxID=1160095 RepID=A0A430AJZ5_9ENTE|nr:Ig-like domain-containing protein [Vagococcus entomophilus]RSU08431.1 hypothetical protein CBF30_04110 [Vagococcus entomophilus]
MADIKPEKFRIYKGTEVAAEGVSPLTIKGVGANKDVAAGMYKVAGVATVDGKEQESKKVDIPAFKSNSIDVTGVTLDQTTLALEVGKTGTVKATVSPDNATNKAVTFTSSDETIVSIDSKGVALAVKAGTADVTVTTADGKKTAKCTVTVTEPAAG